MEQVRRTLVRTAQEHSLSAEQAAGGAAVVAAQSLAVEAAHQLEGHLDAGPHHPRVDHQVTAAHQTPVDGIDGLAEVLASRQVGIRRRRLRLHALTPDVLQYGVHHFGGDGALGGSWFAAATAAGD